MPGSSPTGAVRTSTRQPRSSPVWAITASSGPPSRPGGRAAPGSNGPGHYGPWQWRGSSPGWSIPPSSKPSVAPGLTRPVSRSRWAEFRSERRPRAASPAVTPWRRSARPRPCAGRETGPAIVSSSPLPPSSGSAASTSGPITPRMWRAEPSSEWSSASSGAASSASSRLEAPGPVLTGVTGPVPTRESRHCPAESSIRGGPGTRRAHQPAGRPAKQGGFGMEPARRGFDQL